MKWFYQDDSGEIGPLSETALRELHQCGTFSSTTLIRREDSGDWGTFEDLLASTPDTPDFPATTVEPELRKFYCIHCGQRISADSSQVGMMATCPSCSGEVLIPGEHVNQKRPAAKSPQSTDSVHSRVNEALLRQGTSVTREVMGHMVGIRFIWIAVGIGLVSVSILLLQFKDKPSKHTDTGGNGSGNRSAQSEASQPNRYIEIDSRNFSKAALPRTSQTNYPTYIDTAIRSIEEVYPELSREQQLRKVEQISGMRIRDNVSASRAALMVEQLKGAARLSGMNTGDFFEFSERKQIELRKDVERSWFK
jgi:DNA-directed RNA polymerase subunit RPC12/RpoP